MRVLLVEPDSRVRGGLQRRLSIEPHFSVIGAVTSLEKALAVVATSRPRVILIGMDLPIGAAAVRSLVQASHGAEVVVLSFDDSPGCRELVMRLGAAAFVSKRDGVDQVLWVLQHLASAREEVATVRCWLCGGEVETGPVIRAGTTFCSLSCALSSDVVTCDSRLPHLSDLVGALEGPAGNDDA